MEKTYRTGIRHRADTGDRPNGVVFRIDDDSAREIVRLSALVNTHGLYKVTQFDFRARYTRCEPIAPEYPEGAMVDRVVSTEADCLNVSESEFWFSAYLKHSDIEFSSEALRIADLKECFGLSA